MKSIKTVGVVGVDILPLDIAASSDVATAGLGEEVKIMTADCRRIALGAGRLKSNISVPSAVDSDIASVDLGGEVKFPFTDFRLVSTEDVDRCFQQPTFAEIPLKRKDMTTSEEQLFQIKQLITYWQAVMAKDNKKPRPIKKGATMTIDTANRILPPEPLRPVGPSQRRG